MSIINDGKFEYLEAGEGPVLLLLHGLFGALSNFEDLVAEFEKDFKVIIPFMPIYKKTRVGTTVSGLANYIKEFVEHKKIEKCTALGNSLGGHVGLVFALENEEKVEGLILTGSSGLFESGMGSSFPKRGSYKYIKERVEFTFYDPKSASKELVDEVFGLVNKNYSALRIVKIARAAQKHNMANEIPNIKVPTLLVWGLNDTITPPNVAHEFHRLIPNTELKFIDKCGHAPMMEQPVIFNKYLREFLGKVYNT